MGKVVKLQICSKDSATKRPSSESGEREKNSPIPLKEKRRSHYIQVDSIECIAGVGIAGDDNAKGGDRQVTIIDEAVNQWIANQPEKGLCSSRFKANITLEGENVSPWQQGILLNIGEALLEISSVSKKCYGEWCKLYNKESSCPIPKGCYFAKVARSGEVKNEDMWAIEKVV